ncbi:MAG: ricin-type beta-trefoil lectin domain protein [Myxococcaceae bacterium]
MSRGAEVTSGMAQQLSVRIALFSCLAGACSPPSSEWDPVQSESRAVTTVFAPVGLTVIPGGKSIALRWTHPSSGVAIGRNEIFRDGVQIASVEPGFHPLFPEKSGRGYLDTNVVPGTAYLYRVRSVASDGAVSALSEGASGTLSLSTTAEPTVNLDYSQTPDLGPWLEETVKPFLLVWYPKIADVLARPQYEPSKVINIKMDPSYTGVAMAPGNSIVVNPSYVRTHPQDLGMFLHEAAHVMQQYPGGTPGWIVEGVADWTREYLLHDREPVPQGPAGSFTAGYSAGSYFVQWMATLSAPDLVRTLNGRCRAGKYADTLLGSLTGTGLTVEQLWQKMVDEGNPSLLRFGRIAGKCAEQSYNGQPDSNHVRLQDCSGSPAQRWGVRILADNTVQLHNGPNGMCMTVPGKNNGTPVQAFNCNPNSAEQKFELRAAGLFNPQSGRCIDDPNGSNVNGTPLRLWDCNGSGAQFFIFPTAPM